MSDQKTYVRLDEYGVYRVGTTPISLDSVFHALQRGDSPARIQEQYPALSLEEINGVIAFIQANFEEVARYIQGQDEIWERERAKAETRSSPTVERLRALKKATLPEAS